MPKWTNEKGRTGIEVEGIFVREDDVKANVLLLFGLATALFSVCATLGNASLKMLFDSTDARFFADLILMAFVFIWILILKVFASVLASNWGMLLLYFMAIVGTVVCPLFLRTSLWLLGLALISAGSVALIFLWWSHACTVGRDVLLNVLSGAIAIAALGLILVTFIPDMQVNIEYIKDVVSLALCMMLVLARNETRDELLKVSIAESRQRRRDRLSSKIGRINYFTVGLLLGVDAGLWLLMDGSEVGSPYATPVLMLGTVLLIVGFAMFLSKVFPKIDAEKISKDYLSATLAFGYLLFPLVNGFALNVVSGYLVVIALIQVVIIFLAGAELVRFEQISPIYSFCETSFIAGGMVLGALFASIAGNVVPEHAVPIVCGSTLFYVIIVQIQLNKITFPEEWMDKEGSKIVDSPIYFVSNEAESKMGSEEDIMHQTANDIPASVDDKLIPAGSYLRTRLDEIAVQYKLSPRQKEILDLLARGRDTQYVMEAFTISRATAKTHVYNIYRKLDIHSRQDLFDLIENEDTSKH